MQITFLVNDTAIAVFDRTPSIAGSACRLGACKITQSGSKRRQLFGGRSNEHVASK